MKKSFLIFETIISVILFLTIFLTSTYLILYINNYNHQNYNTNLNKIKLETTKLFLEHTLQKEKNLNNINYTNNQLFYKTYLLDNNITLFEINKQNNIYNIDIKYNDTTSMHWVLLLK
jgi:hypothetical protein